MYLKYKVKRSKKKILSLEENILKSYLLATKLRISLMILSF